MAYSYNIFAGTGAQTNFSITFPYLKAADVSAKVDGVSVGMSFLSSSIVQIIPAPAAGKIVEIRRNTQKTEQIVVFQNSSVLSEEELNLLARYDLFLAQESADSIESTIRVTSTGVFDAINRRVVNVGTPTGPQDAATKAYVDAGTAGTIANAQAAVEAAISANISAGDALVFRSDAQAAAAAAAASQSDANASKIAAATSATNANTYQGQAQTYRDTTLGYRDTANTAATTATTARDTTLGYRDTANTAASNASTSAGQALTSRNEAQTFRGEALSYRDTALTHRNDAETFKNQAAASAAGVNLPAIVANNFLQANSGGSAYISRTAAQVATSLYTQADWTADNLFQNGAFDIWQFAASFAVPAAGLYTADQCFSSAGTGGTATATRINADWSAAHAGRYAYQYSQTVAGSTAPVILRKFVEGVHNLQQQASLFSFYAKVATGTLSVQPRIRQHFGTGGSPSATVDTAIGSPITLTTAWQRFLIPVTPASIAGKVFGTNNDDHLEFDLTGPTGATFVVSLEEVELRRGTNFDSYHFIDPAIELARCQRFYWQQGGGAIGDVLAFGWSYTTTIPYTRHEFPVQMRAAPVMTYDAKASLFQILTGSGAANANVPSSFQIDTNLRGATVQWPGSAAIAAGAGLLIRNLAAGQAIFWNARLPT